MSTWQRILLILLLAGGCAGGLRAAEPLAARVILLANASDPDSLKIAQHYAEVRGVPAANIVALPMAQEETITWPEFVTTIWQPLQDELMRRGWIDAMPMALTDAVGRKKLVVVGHRISYLVVCRGVPLRIAHSDALLQAQPARSRQNEFHTNAGAVDSELSLLAVTNYPVDGFIPNPLFQNDHPAGRDAALVVKVSRLDGPTAADALGLVDHALEAERTGLLGRAYVDLSGRDPVGDQWLKDTGVQLQMLRFDIGVDRAPASFSAAARFDAPVLYFGWYEPNLNGPFALPGFHFPPGAIAEHIHSASAETLRSTTVGWCGPLVARGVTATVGNVYEPYLGFLHRPDLLLKALARGDTFGDAAYYAEPVLSWQAIAIGDPLYRPFARSFEEQWQDRASLPPALAGYAALREIHRWESTQDLPVSLTPAQVEEFQKTHPSLPVAFDLAKRQERGRDPAKAVDEFAGYEPPPQFATDQWVLANEAARLLGRAKAPTAAEKIYVSLLRCSTLPHDLRVAWLREATQIAQAAGDVDQAMAWAKELGQLDPDERK